MAGGIVTTFLAALQAAISVLLTVVYGVIAAQFKLLSPESAKNVSRLCVNMFLPALLMTNVGSELRLDSVMRYLPLLVWSLLYNFISIGIGVVCTRLFQLPGWVTLAVTFNNTTALPLLLVQSLGTTNILNSLLMGPHDTQDAALARANSYFLINAMVGDTLTFGLGPKLLGCSAEDADHDGPKRVRSSNVDNYGGITDPSNAEPEEDYEPDEEEIHHAEGESLLPNRFVRKGIEWRYHAHKRSQIWWAGLPEWLQNSLDLTWQFVNAPMIGAIIGAIIGLVPPLHRAFFNDEQNGGFFNAWLTISIQNIGALFPALQVIVVGVKLTQSLMAMKNGEEGGKVGLRPALFVLFVRYVLWTLLGISTIWALAKYTSLLSDDPILWFSMMIMVIGPSAMKLTAMADVSGAPEEEKMAIAKFLTVSYIISPIMAVVVVASLYACENAM